MIDDKTLNEKYFNVYVDVLSQTLHQQVLGNVSLQAKSKINDEITQEYQNEIGRLQEEVKKANEKVLETESNLRKEIERLKLDSISTQSEKDKRNNEEITNLKNTISNLHTEISRLNVFKEESERLKHQLVHLDTFKNDLIKTQEIVKQKDVVIKELNGQIDYLKLTPAQRRKIDSAKAATEKKEEPKKIEVPKEVLSGAPKAKIIKQELPNLVVKDGGNF